MRKTKQGYHYTGSERLTLYIYAVGGSIFTSLVGAFTTFLTDIGIAAGIVSIILLITRVWDFVNDPIAGFIIEKSNLKGGKYKPYLKVSTILLPILGTLMFFVPSSLSLTAKVVLSTFLWLLWEGVFTFLDIPIFGIRLVSTDNVQERTDIASVAGIFAGVGLLIGSAVFPLIRGPLGWQKTAVIFAAVALVTIVWYPWFAKERFKSEESEPSFFAMVRAIARNKQLLIYYGSILVCMSTNFTQVIGLYTARHVFGDEALLTPILLALLLPALVAGVFIPILSKKIDKFNIFRLSLVGFAITGVISYVVGYQNFTLVLILMALRGVFLGVSSLLAYAFTPDMVEWQHYTTGERNEAISFSFQTFTAKAITALLSVLMMAILATFGFVSGEGAVQPQLVTDGIWAMFTWLPSVGAAVSLIGFHFYKIRDKKVQIMIRCNHNEIDRDTAEEQLKQLGGY